MKLNCIIIDDEPVARKGLQEYIAEVDFLQLVDSCESPMKANSALKKEKVDLIFLDIEMPKINGIEFLKVLSEPPLVIITTAYPEYAIQGYELDIMDYLLKPVSLERFLKACNKARDFYRLRQGAALPGAQNFFFIKCDSKYEKILYDDIVFVEAMENFISVQTRDKKFVTWLTLKSAEDKLPADRFIKTHRSFIVSLSQIDRIEGSEIKAGGFSVPISKALREEVMEKILNRNLLKRS